MKINIILPALGKSGGIDVIYKYAQLLTEKGHDVIVYKSIISYNMKRYSNIFINTIHQIYCSIKSCFEYKNRNKVYDKYVISVNNKSIRDADIVFATAWPTAYLVNNLQHSKGEKYYFIQDFEVWDNEEQGLNSYNLPLKKIVISTWINNKLKEHLNIGPFPVIYNGIDKTKFYNENKHFHSEEKIQCLLLNHKLPKKGVQIGIEVFEKCREYFPEITLKMFGLCDSNNLPEYIDYIQNPNDDDLIKLYSESDIFIFPSIEEGWGLTPLEAMACKCAVVASKTGFVLDISTNYENILISDPGDKEMMVKNLMMLIKDSKLRNQISISGYELTSGLSWEKSVNKLIKLLEDKI